MGPTEAGGPSLASRFESPGGGDSGTANGRCFRPYRGCRTYAPDVMCRNGTHDLRRGLYAVAAPRLGGLGLRLGVGCCAPRCAPLWARLTLALRVAANRGIRARTTGLGSGYN